MTERKKASPTGLGPIFLSAGLIAVVSMTAGCASGHSGATASPGSLPRIVIERTGGFAGLKDTVSVDPHGAWTVTNRAGTRTAGALTADQIAAVRPLATDPRLAAEAERTPVATKCRDAFHYVLTVGATQVSYADCPADPGQPVASIALVRQVLRFTLLDGSRH
jgi:hypothetical protein